MKDRFELGSHLTYVLEAAVAKFSGEAKFELNSVIAKVRRSAIQDRDEILDLLLAAADYYKEGDEEQAGRKLSAASRKLQSGIKWPN